MIIEKSQIELAESVKFEAVVTAEAIQSIDTPDDMFTKLLEDGLVFLSLELLPYGLDVRKQELIFDLIDDFATLQSKLIMRWRAPREAIKLTGGEADGIIVQIPYWNDVYAVKTLVKQVDPDLPELDDQVLHREFVDVQSVDYNYAGFDTEDRVTVFKVAE